MTKQITSEMAEKMRVALDEAMAAINASGGNGAAASYLDSGRALYFSVDGEEYRARADSLAFYGRLLVWRVSDGAFVGRLVFDY